MKILIAGDLRVGEKSNFSIDNINDKINANDYFLFNLESPIVNKAKVEPIPKNGPNLCMYADSLSSILKYNHKIIMAGANNHLGDFGEEGIYGTLKFFKDNDILKVGCGKNIAEASKPLILKDNVALVAIAENEFGMASEDKAGANPLKIEKNLIQVMDLTREGYTVVVYFHGGNEYSPIPNPFIKRLYRSFINAGAKAVIGNHTHCPQGYELYKEGLIFYSLGNFVFEKRVPSGLKNKLKQKIKKLIRDEIPNFWYIGYLVALDMENAKINFELIPVIYENDQLQRMEHKQKEHFLQYIKQLSDIINDKEEYTDLWNSWTSVQADEVQKKISGFSYAKIHKEDKKFLAFKNQLTCESHRELLLNMNYLIENDKLEKYHDVDKIKFLQNPDNFGILK
ncbi:MAG: hypothetical protein COB07_11670 [Sulfurovum sp.]|nr:MAG: hypothetical protein COB07_11670 [Sulfurovum sp.]